jgi:hypothetical protein
MNETSLKTKKSKKGKGRGKTKTSCNLDIPPLPSTNFWTPDQPILVLEPKSEYAPQPQPDEADYEYILKDKPVLKPESRRAPFAPTKLNILTAEYGRSA